MYIDANYFRGKSTIRHLFSFSFYKRLYKGVVKISQPLVFKNTKCVSKSIKEALEEPNSIFVFQINNSKSVFSSLKTVTRGDIQFLFLFLNYNVRYCPKVVDRTWAFFHVLKILCFTYQNRFCVLNLFFFSFFFLC